MALRVKLRDVYTIYDICGYFEKTVTEGNGVACFVLNEFMDEYTIRLVGSGKLKDVLRIQLFALSYKEVEEIFNNLKE